MIITVESPLKLKSLLATMKSAKEKKVAMAIWDCDIEAVQEAIATIEAIHKLNL